MKCILCGKNYIIKRNFKNLFNFNKKYICDNCIKKYKPNLNYKIYIYKAMKIHWLFIFEKDYKINYYVFLKEITKLTELALLQDIQILYFYSFDDFLLVKKELSLMFNEIIIITFY